MLNSLEWISCAMTGSAVFSIALLFMSIFLMPRIDLNATTNQNRRRIQSLRLGSVIYRLFEPILPQFAAVPFFRGMTRYGTLKKYIASGAAFLPFSTNELVGWVILRGIIIALGTFAIMSLLGMMGVGAFLAMVIAVLYPLWFGRKAQRATRDRLHQITRRLAHATDLLAMQLNAGASFRNSFLLITKELHGHPLGEEFERAIRDTEQGMSFRDALDQLQQRIPTDDIKDFVSAIQSSQRRGTPLAKTLNNLAEQMRRYRTERAERAAGEAQANITFPGLVMMGACLLVLLAPFVLQLIEENPFDF